MNRGRSSRIGFAAVALGAAAAFGASASGSPLLRPPAGTPDPKTMVLVSGDLGGAKISHQGYFKDTGFPSVISYEREFDQSKVGRTVMIDVDSQAEIGTSAASTTRFFANARRLFGSRAFKAELKKQLVKDFGSGLGVASHPQVGRLHPAGVGARSFDLPITFRILGLRAEVHFTVFQVERVLGFLGTVGTPGKRVPLSVLRHLGNLMAGRMAAQLAPKNTVLPTVTGMPQVGQTLSATTGTWSGGPTTFAYQWQRCDAAGASCVAIPSATTSTYLLGDGDAGSTVRVAVTARGTAGSASAVSAQTVVVAVAGAPSSTALPTISGTPQVGQTLTATTGAWNGGPTSFSFQWQRCNPSGASCAAVSGATAGSYSLTSADSGSTIRVAVAATNGLGSATAVSLPTAQVP